MIFDFSKYSENLAVIDENYGRFSYSELLEQTKKIFSHINRRCLVLILCENEIAPLASFLACMQNNAVPILLDSKICDEDLRRYLELYHPDFVVVPESRNVQERFLNGADGDISELKTCKMSHVHSFFGYSLLNLMFEESAKLSEDLALLLTTSGSTGSPKLVRLSYENIEANLNDVCGYLKLRESDRTISSLPMNYTYGLSVICTHLRAGASLVLTNKGMMQREFWTMLETFQITNLSGVPYTYEMMNRLRFVRKDRPYLRMLTQAGGHLDERLQRVFAQYCNEFSKEFFVMYGQTEAGPRMAFVPPERIFDKIGSIGLPVASGKFVLRDDSGIEIHEPDTPGILFYYGRNVCLGYAFSYSDLSKGDENQGCLNTGDIGYFDKDGYVFLIGRASRFLKIFGNRVNLDECQKLLRKQFGDFECMCTGVDNKLTIVIEQKGADKQDDVVRFLSDRMHIHFSGLDVQVVENLPKNSAGKLLYGSIGKKS